MRLVRLCSAVCTTLFRDVCGDNSLLLSTVVSLPCEVSTEALISDLELTGVRVDRFTAETTNLTDGCALIGWLCSYRFRFAGIFKIPLQRTHSKNVILSSHPSPGLPDLEQSHAASPRARLLLRRPSAGYVLSPGPVAPRSPLRCRSVVRELACRPALHPARPSRSGPDVGCHRTPQCS